MNIAEIEKLASDAEAGSLTRDEADAALFIVEGLLADIGAIVPIEKAEGEPLPFEESMGELLLTGWSRASKSAVEIATKRLLSQGGKLTPKQVKEILALISSTIDKTFKQPVSEKLGGIMVDAYTTAKKGVAKRLRQKVTFDEFDALATTWLTEHHMFWIGGYYDKHCSGAIAKEITDGMAEGLGRDAIGDRLKSAFDKYPGVRIKPGNYWRGMAANGMNRARSFGSIAAWEEVGITQLEIVNPDDERTSAICHELNGKIIPVTAVVDQRDKMMLADDPEDVKTIAPWLKAEAVKDLNGAALAAAGIGMPPYHFFCRTMIVERS